MSPVIAVAACVCLILLLVAEKRESLAGKLIFKPLLSSLFVWTALVQPRPEPIFAALVLTGLIFSWIGDLLLIFASRAVFLAGLVAFLLGHVAYAIGFYHLGVWNFRIAVILGGLLVVGALFFRWLRPHLGKMTGPVAGYIGVISVMLGGAAAVFAASHLGVGGRWCVLAGAIVFYVSDICVARDRFVSPGFANRALGLPLYYLGQFLFALSLGLIA